MAGKITDLTSIPAIDRAVDLLEVVDVSANASYNVTPNALMGISSAALGTTDVQSPTNKTFDNTNAFTVKDTNFTLQDDGDTTKQVKFQNSGISTGTTRTFTWPDRSSTVATLGGNQVFTGANSFTGGTWSGGTIDNATVTVDAITGHTSANTGTIYGISVTSGTIPAAAIATGAVTYTKLGTDSSYVWQAWTTTLGNMVQGNGVVDAKYTQIGKTLLFRFAFILGSSSSVGTGPTFTLPATPRSFSDTSSGSRPIGLAHFEHNGVGADEGVVAIAGTSPTSTASLLVYNASGTYLNYTQPTSTVPFTFVSGDSIWCQGMLEVA